MPSHHTHWLSDAEVAANAPLLAAQVIAHPLTLQLSTATIEVLSAIAVGDAPVSTAAERTFLRQAMAVIDAAELALGAEVSA